MKRNHLIIKQVAIYVWVISLVFYSLTPVFSMPVFASEKVVEDSQGQDIQTQTTEVNLVVKPTEKPVETNPTEITDHVKPDDSNTTPNLGSIEEDILPDEQNRDEDPVEPYVQKDEIKSLTDTLNIDADAATGAFIYRYPIEIPKGRNGLQPGLQLAYNNQNTSNQNLFGYGWSLNIPYVERLNKKGVDKLYTEDYFSSSLTGELVPVDLIDDVHGVYASRVENGEFLKYEFTTSTAWQVTDKQGIVYTFGASAASRQDNPSESTEVFKWLLTELRDTNDNFIRYEYYKDDGQIYPDTVFYTGHGETDGIFEVEFLREARNDVFTSFNTGFQVDTDYLIDEIQVKIDDQWVKKYELDYVVGDNDKRSLLNDITESGKDSQQNIITLPADEFIHENGQAEFSDNEIYEMPTSIASASGFDIGVRAADINGDGLTDIIKSIQLPGPVIVKTACINNSQGWDCDSNYDIPVLFLTQTGEDTGVRIADVDGDGLADLIKSKSPDGPDDRRVYINNGEGWDYDDNYYVPPIYFSSGANDSGVRPADVNNDGLVDLIKSIHDGFDDRRIYINDGQGWTLDETWVFPTYIIGDSYPDRGVRIVDVNNDGLVDVIQANTHFTRNVYINNGHGWDIDATYTIPAIDFTSGTDDSGVRLADINGDGLIDFIKSESPDGSEDRRVYINDGHGWDYDDSYYIPPMYFNVGARMIDVDGDGAADFIKGNEPDDRESYINLAKAESLVQINTSQGSRISIDYKPSTQYLDDTDLANPDLPFILQTVKQIDIFDGLATTTIDYDYAGGEYYYADIDDRKLAGFVQVTKTIDDQKQITYYHQGNDTDSSQGEYQDNFYKIGKPYRTEIYDDTTEELWQQQINKWETYDLGDDDSFVYNSQAANTNFSTTTKSTVSQFAYSTSTGNLLTENNLGEVTINTGTGVVTDQLTGDEKDVDYEYAENTTKHILAAPKQKIISDTQDSKTQELYYDDLPLGQVNKVNLTKEDYIIDDVEVRREFNDYGLVNAEIDPKNATTTISYDSYNLYPDETTNALNHTTYTEYNLLNGQIATSTDPNGLVTVNDFDAFGRIVETKISNPASPSTLVTKQEIVYEDNSFPRYKQVKDYFEVSEYATTREYYDGLDRVIQKKIQTDTANEWSTIDITYDSQGRTTRQSLPYITAIISYSSPDLQQAAKTYTYDALNRILTETTPTGTTSYQYDGWTTIITDANGNQKDLTRDAYGNLVQVKEYNGQEIYTTDYEYSLTNKLTKITDALGNVRNFVYDDLDNLVSQDMIHDPSVQNPAEITYTYDKNGNVVSKTNFNGQTLNYTYDALNRVLTEKLGISPRMSYAYDIGQYNIGKLTNVFHAYNGNLESYDYDILGRTTDYNVRINGDNYAVDYDYNLTGSLESVTYPDAKVATYTFNDIGQVESVSVASSTIVSNLEYNVNGQLVHLERDNGVVTDYTYDPDQNFRLTDLVTTYATTTLQDLDYTYDDVGNILSITDSSDTDLAKTASYAYDDLNRLASTTVSFVNLPALNYSQQFTYDAIGNMLTNSDLGTYAYQYDNPHQLSSIGTQDFVYDLAGNLTNDETKILTWDWESRMTKSQNTGATAFTLYEYDSSNQRLLKQSKQPQEVPIELGGFSFDGGGIESLKGGGDPPPSVQYIITAEEHYIDQYFQKDDKNGDSKDHIFVNGQKIATINNNDDPYYILGDHLGSSSILLDNNGTIAENTDYKPFGSEVYNDTVTDLDDDYTFTGQEYDEETDIQYFGARYLDNELGRFTAIEPVMMILHDGNKLKKISGQELQKILADPQALNSYSYSKNNPVIFVDPDGNWWKAFFTGQQSWSSFQTELGQAAQQLYNDSSAAKTIMDHPYASGAVIGIGSGLAAYGISAGVTAGLTQLGVIGTQADKVDDVVDFTQKYGQNFGTRMNQAQKVFQEAGIKFDPHLVLRTAERVNRGVTPDKVMNAINSGTKYYDTLKNNYSYFHNGIRVAQELDGTFKTVVTQTSMNAERFIKLLK